MTALDPVVWDEFLKQLYPIDHWGVFCMQWRWIAKGHMYGPVECYRLLYD